MKDSKQLECQLHCKASAELQEDIQRDLQIKDKSLGELLDENGKQETEGTDQPDG
jgi:hypothetical protein